MAAKAEKLDVPETSLDMENRQVAPASAAVSPAEAQLNALRQRILTGMNCIGEDPRPKGAPACRDCFQRGWIEALRALNANG